MNDHSLGLIKCLILTTCFYLYKKSSTWQFPLHCSIFIQGISGTISGSNVNFMNMEAT